MLNSRADFGPSEVAVRINSISSGLAEDDLSAMFERCDNSPGTVVVPKVDNVDEAKWVCVGMHYVYPSEHESFRKGLMRK